jgi:hypothetical protein
MEKEFSNGNQATDIGATMSTIRDMVMAKCTGMMAVFTKGNGRRAYNTVRAFYRCQMEGSKRGFSRKTSL